MGGLITEAVLDEQLGSMALSHCHSFATRVPPVEDHGTIGREFGLGDLPRILAALERLMEDDSEVRTEIGEGQAGLMIETRHGSVHFPALRPGVVMTRCSPQQFETMADRFEPTAQMSLDRQIVKYLGQAIHVLQATELMISGEIGGEAYIHLRSERGQAATVPVPNARVDELVSASFRPAELLGVLRCVRDWTDAELAFSGPHGLVRLTEGGWTTFLAPLEVDHSPLADLQSDLEAFHA